MSIDLSCYGVYSLLLWQGNGELIPAHYLMNAREGISLLNPVQTLDKAQYKIPGENVSLVNAGRLNRSSE